MMPASSQTSSPPPSYINHRDFAAEPIEVLHQNPERGSSKSTNSPNSPITPITPKNLEDQVSETQQINEQTPITPAPVSNIIETTSTNADKLISQLEQSIQRLEIVLLRHAGIDANSSNIKDTRKPIKLKDAVGRRYTFPYYRCETWAGLAELIKSAFLHVDIIGPHVNDGRYDIWNSAGEVILPQVWEDHVQPGWEISMHMWPMPTVKPKLPPPAPSAPIHVIVDSLPGSPPPAPCVVIDSAPPRYNFDDISIVSRKKGFQGLWQKVRGVFTRKDSTNYHSDGSSSIIDE